MKTPQTIFFSFIANMFAAGIIMFIAGLVHTPSVMADVGVMIGGVLIAGLAFGTGVLTWPRFGIRGRAVFVCSLAMLVAIVALGGLFMSIPAMLLAPTPTAGLNFIGSFVFGLLAASGFYAGLTDEPTKKE